MQQTSQTTYYLIWIATGLNQPLPIARKASGWTLTAQGRTMRSQWLVWEKKWPSALRPLGPHPPPLYLPRSVNQVMFSFQTLKYNSKLAFWNVTDIKLWSNVNSITLTGELPSKDVRLVGGSNIAEGRIEVKREDGSWGSVCDDSWGLSDAQVVCRMLCYK